ncbi:MAG: hypothetical protein SFU98_20185 [Leptospiraceae bacterium]|nr:hypothetical protein [Leptospiraceae bacterium]
MNGLSKKIIFVSRILLISLSLFFLVSFYILTVNRIGHKLNNGPYEDFTLQIASRILDGQKIYGEPNVEYVPPLYAPILFYLSALTVKLLDKSLPTIRLVSLISNLGILFFTLIIFKQVVSRKNYLVLGLSSLGLFYSCFQFTGLWLDIAKVDAIFLLEMSIILYLTLKYLDNLKPSLIILTALFSILLIYTKQSGLLFVFFFAFYIFFLQKYSHLVLYIISCAIFFTSFSYYFYLREGINFFTYNFVIPKTHPFDLKLPLEEVKKLLPSIGIILIGIQLSLFQYKKSLFRFSKNPEFKKLRSKLEALRFFFSKKKTYLLLITVLFFIVSYLGRSKGGAVENSWLYFYYYSSILSVFMFEMFVCEYLKISNKLKYITTFLLILSQFFLFRYNPFIIFENQKMLVQKESKFIESYCALPQPILYPDTAFYGDMFCNSSQTFFLMSAIDLLYYEPFFNQFSENYSNAIKEKKFKTIFMFKDYSKENLDMLINFIQSESKLGKKLSLEQKNFLKSLELYRLVHDHYTKISEKDYTDAQKNVLDYRKAYSVYEAKN